MTMLAMITHPILIMKLQIHMRQVILMEELKSMIIFQTIKDTMSTLILKRDQQDLEALTDQRDTMDQLVKMEIEVKMVMLDQ